MQMQMNPPASTGNLSCLGILQCAVECPSTDTACPDACSLKGTSVAQTNVAIFADCANSHSCSDATCLQAQCKTSLETCVGSSAPKSDGTPLTGNAPPGSVPADLAGVWSNTNYGQTRRLTLNADGTGSWYSGIANVYSSVCTQLNTTTEAGTVVVDTGTITVYATTVTHVEKVCAADSTTTQGSPITEVFTWTHPDANTLGVVDSACAAKYPDSPSSATLYCSVPLTRQ
jgi:hypothetical protein